MRRTRGLAWYFERAVGDGMGAAVSERTASEFRGYARDDAWDAAEWRVTPYAARHRDAAQ
jgi:hypothetical protein